MRASRWIRLIGLWEMAGGALALVTFLETIHVAAGSPVATILLAAAILLLPASSFLAGYGLYRGKATALVPSLCLQGLQLIGFNLGTAVYQATLGPYVYLTIVWNQGVTVGAGVKSLLILRWAVSPPMDTGAAIDLLACFCFWKLLWVEPQQLQAVARLSGRARPRRSPEASRRAAPDT